MNDTASELDAKVSIERAVDLFLSTKEFQGVGDDALGKYRREMGRLKTFLLRKSCFFPSDITLEVLTEYRITWLSMYPASKTRSMVQARLRSFLRYCLDAKYIDRITRLSAIRLGYPPTLPLTDEQYEMLLDATAKTHDPRKAARLRGVILLMRWSGLAVCDAVMLVRSGLTKEKHGYRVRTKRQKTGTEVNVVIPPFVGEELKKTMQLNRHPDYIFWNSGGGKMKTLLSNWGMR